VGIQRGIGTDSLALGLELKVWQGVARAGEHDSHL